jgi:hypothetical protein
MTMSSREVLPVVVYLAANHLEAEVVRGRLESEGIPAILQYESAGLVFGLTIDGIGETRVLVPGPMAARARDVLAGPDEGTASEEPSDQETTGTDAY